MLHEESIILKIGNCDFSEATDFVAKEVHYYQECKRNYLYKEDKPSDTKDSAMERLHIYIRNKIIPEKISVFFARPI